LEHIERAISFFDPSSTNDTAMANSLIGILKGAQEDVPSWLESYGSGGGFGMGGDAFPHQFKEIVFKVIVKLYPGICF